MGRVQQNIIMPTSSEPDCDGAGVRDAAFVGRGEVVEIAVVAVAAALEEDVFCPNAPARQRSISTKATMSLLRFLRFLRMVIPFCWY